MAPDRPGKDSPLRRDIERQPSVLAALQLRQAEFITAGHTWLRPDAGGRLFVAGCGDGYFAAAAAQNFAERLHLAWQVTGPLDLLLGSARLTPADRLLVISMSGNVDRTVESALAAKAAGTPVLALVNSPRGGRLGEIANAWISLQLEDLAPFLCGTSSYTATLLALLALAVGAADGLAVPSLDTILDAQRLALAQTDGVLHKLGLPSGVRLLSAGADRATVAYGAAKLVELTRIPAWSGDLEEFAHSQYWSMATTDLVLVVATDPALARYADETCEALHGLGVVTVAVDTPVSPVRHATHRITLPPSDAALAPLATAVPLQLLAAGLARLSGLDPDTRAHLKSDATRFRVSRLLTRRSLVGTGH